MQHPTKGYFDCCMDCPKRKPACSDKCEEYAAGLARWRADEKARAEERARRNIDGLRGLRNARVK